MIPGLTTRVPWVDDRDGDAADHTVADEECRKQGPVIPECVVAVQQPCFKSVVPALMASLPTAGSMGLAGLTTDLTADVTPDVVMDFFAAAAALDDRRLGNVCEAKAICFR